MDFFSSDAYLTALARDYYRAKSYELKTYHIGGRFVRLAEINGKTPAVSGPFYDYVKPVPDPPAGAPSVRFVPKLVTRTVALDDLEPRINAPETAQEPAPVVEWAQFSSWDDYRTFVKKRSARLLLNRHFRKFLADYGEPVFQFSDPSPEALDKCLSWKMNQYAGGHETLSDRRAVTMLRRLHSEGHLTVSTLRIGDHYISAHACVRETRRHLSLMSSYDQDFAQYSIGTELLHRMLESSYRQGDEAFDFLQGGETYKWDYATHLQIIEAAGQPPLTYRLSARGQRLARNGVRKLSPALFVQLRRLALTAKRIRSGFHSA